MAAANALPRVCCYYCRKIRRVFHTEYIQTPQRLMEILPAHLYYDYCIRASVYVCRRCRTEEIIECCKRKELGFE